MKRYTVEWLRGSNVNLPSSKQISIEADSPIEAARKASVESANPNYSEIFVSWDGGHETFSNPYFDPSLEVVRKSAALSRNKRESHTTTSDGSGGHVEKIAGSSPKEKPQVYLEHERVIYLERVRATSCYPVYRRVIKVLTAFSYIVTVILALVGVAVAFQGKDGSIATGIGAIVVCLFLFYDLIPLQKEVSLMFVDLVDSTLDRNSRS